MSYPTEPGYKGDHDTGRDAAAGVAAIAGTLRDRVFAQLRVAAGTPEEVARAMEVPVHSIRPRFSELLALGRIEDSGGRGTAMGGRRAIRWRVKS